MAPALSLPRRSVTVEDYFAPAFEKLRSADNTNKPFEECLRDHSNEEEELVQRSISALDADFLRFLRQDPRKWTLSALQQLTRTPSPTVKERRGIYGLLAAHYVYGGSSRNLPGRYQRHTDEATAALKGDEYEQKLFYDKRLEVGQAPLYVHAATGSRRLSCGADEDDHCFFLELLESAVVIIVDLLPHDDAGEAAQSATSADATVSAVLFRRFTPVDITDAANATDEDEIVVRQAPKRRRPEHNEPGSPAPADTIVISALQSEKQCLEGDTAACGRAVGEENVVTAASSPTSADTIISALQINNQHSKRDTRVSELTD
ncbi:hypothetical protein LTR65_006603 [Meristemomyces frigidus]